MIKRNQEKTVINKKKQTRFETINIGRKKKAPQLASNRKWIDKWIKEEDEEKEDSPLPLHSDK